MLYSNDTDNDQCCGTNSCVDWCDDAVGLNETKSSEAGSDDGWDQISDSADTESDEEGCKSDQIMEPFWKIISNNAMRYHTP